LPLLNQFLEFADLQGRLLSSPGKMDEVLVDYSEVLYLSGKDVGASEKLKEQISRRKVVGYDAGLTPLWGFLSEQYLAQVREAVKDLELERIAQGPYHYWHGGAQRDLLLKSRTVSGIQRRSRWACRSSARIYAKPGRLLQVVNLALPRLVKYAAAVTENLCPWFQSSMREVPPS
jgi:hypothetical protein